MPITATDILLKLSRTAGTAGNQGTSTPAGSLGKYISQTVWDQGTLLNNLFDDVTGDDNAASDVEYRCIFVHNAHATLTYQNAVCWLSAEVTGGADAAISVDTTAASALAATGAQAKEVANEDTAPATQTFTAPTTKATGLVLGSLTAGQVKAIWVRRTATNSAALNDDGFTLSVSGDTAP